MLLKINTLKIKIIKKKFNFNSNKNPKNCLFDQKICKYQMPICIYDISLLILFFFLETKRQKKKNSFKI